MTTYLVGTVGKNLVGNYSSYNSTKLVTIVVVSLPLQARIKDWFQRSASIWSENILIGCGFRNFCSSRRNEGFCFCVFVSMEEHGEKKKDRLR